MPFILMRLALFVALLSAPLYAMSQARIIKGRVVNEADTGIAGAQVVLMSKSAKIIHETNASGEFLFSSLSSGRYYLTIQHAGYEPYTDSIRLSDSDKDMGTIILQPRVLMLDEVKITEKVLAMVQKDDTMEYSSGAYKVNPDADAADLVRKMPLIELSDKKLTAQGEAVVKVLVDGKPFFGDDPYASLKNIPADMIDKVQVYSEKSDQERFTGFREGPVSKTINIITRADRKTGVFGKAYAGGGADNSSQDIYGAGLSLNSFGGDRRITITAQANNINAQSFTDQNTAGGNGGIATTHAAGINYSDKWGHRVDVSGSCFYNSTATDVYRDLRKTYMLPSDSGQVYNEYNPSASRSTAHNINLRLRYTADSLNTLLWVPRLTLNNGDATSLRRGYTTQDSTDVNRTSNTNSTGRNAYTLSSTLLYTHRFIKAGRTFSADINAGNNYSSSNTLQQAQNILPKPCAQRYV